MCPKIEDYPEPEETLTTPSSEPSIEEEICQKELVQEIERVIDSSSSSDGSAYKYLARIDSIWDEYLQDKLQDREDRKQERELKGKYADSFLAIAKWQLVAVACAVTASAVKLADFKQNELPIIIAGTLAEVFGIVYVIARSLFDKGSKTSSDSEHPAGLRKIKEMSDIIESLRSSGMP